MRFRSAIHRAASFFFTLAGAAVVSFSLPGPAAATETGTLEGTVVDAVTGEALAWANVQLISVADPATKEGRMADAGGNFSVENLPPGRYRVVVNYSGSEHVEEVAVGAAPTTEVVLRMTVASFQMEEVIITGNPTIRPEKASESAASTHVLHGENMKKETRLTIADHMQATPGVDVVRSGLNQSNVVVRGFNNVFSGATLSLVDYRIARVPSLRYNAYNMIPTVNEDIDRIEIVSGPASALYGPNSANGVVHVLTRSPFGSEGTSVSVAGGNRDVLLTSVRHAGTRGSSFGYKFTGQYYQGHDFEFVDPVEEANREEAIAPPRQETNTRIGDRDFDVQKFGLEGRFDYRPSLETHFILSGGVNQVSDIELTAIGAAQAKDFQTAYAQVRAHHQSLFWQAYLNQSNAGDSYNLRTGEDFIDRSKIFVTELQHGIQAGERTSLTYGADVHLTRPDTEGSINGRNEEDDDINEFGAYAQAKIRPDSQWTFLAAARVDEHNRLENPVFSPRAAVMYGPSSKHTFRLTYNRAFSTPTTPNLFLDLRASENIGGLGYDLFAKGVPTGGYRFTRDSEMGGLDGLFMQVPEALGGSGQSLPADATLMWPVVQQIVGANHPEIGGIPAPSPDRVASVLRVLNPTEETFELVDPSYVQDVDELRPVITNTFEVGYKGRIGNRLSAAVDVYHTRIKDFVGPLRVETPNVFYDPATLGAYLSDPSFGLAPEDIAAITQDVASIPVGTVTPDGNQDPADLVLTYRNFGDVDVTGIDIDLFFFLADEWGLGVSGSFVNENFFEDVGGVADLALNAPKNKAGAVLTYGDRNTPLDASLRLRYVDAFPVQSGVYNGGVRAYTLADLSASYELPFADRTSFSVSVLNLLDHEHREMVGAPAIGRVAIARLTKSF